MVAGVAGNLTLTDEIFDYEDCPWSYNELRMLQHSTKHCMKTHMRYFFKQREAHKFIANLHHNIIFDTLKKTITGELVNGQKITRLIINVPPGYSKTEIAVINFITYGLCQNHRARFMHLSYSDDLALGNSQVARDVVESDEFQRLHNMQIRNDVSSKKKWWTEKGGGVYAAAAGGSVTGFRAGRMMKNFSGALIIDDPIKPEDYFHEKIRNKINRRFNTTFKSRLAHEDVPIILIMQRIGFNDPTGFLLNGGTGEKWHHLRLPVSIKRRQEPYNEKKWPYGIEVLYKLPAGPLWMTKHNRNQINTLRVSDPMTCEAQYDQDPRSDGGKMFTEDMFTVVDAVPAGGISVRGWDLAASDDNNSPYTVGLKMTWFDRIFYIEHVLRIQKGPLDVENSIRAIASADGKGTIIDLPQDPGQAGKSQIAYMLTKLPGYDVRYSPESGSKQTRASGLAGQAEAGNVRLLRGSWNKPFIDEAANFPDGTFKDQIDAASRAFHRIIEELVVEGNQIRVGRTKGMH